MSNPFSLAGQVALVTGSSRGLGVAFAEALGRAGAHVVLNARGRDELERSAAALCAKGIACSSRAFDVTDGAAVAAAISGIVAERGRLDTLVANAGIVHRAPLAEFSTADFRRVVEINLTACFDLAREASRPMVKQGRGRLIFTTSIMGVVGRPTIPSYVASKTGLIGLVRSLAAELGPQGVTANAIAPGYFKTELNKALWTDPKFNAMVEARTPLGRWGLPPELGGAAVFLASDAASYVNGHNLVIDGGMTAVL
ncbi:MAG: SDR family oxidoreductase [Alphaproteobacteria bacterium]|nr:SDR family oxidoreductase [Alphaproteobacteria bacterium]